MEDRIEYYTLDEQLDQGLIDYEEYWQSVNQERESLLSHFGKSNRSRKIDPDETMAERWNEILDQLGIKDSKQ